MTNVITRFAPSPTGGLHIGSARTALFNLIYAKHFGGKFRLRIEDTDFARSKPEFTQLLMQDLRWLSIEENDEVVHQSARLEEYKKYAHHLVEIGKAYYCDRSYDELAQLHRENKKVRGKRCGARDNNPIRLLIENGATEIHDLVQGKITINHEELDDMVLMRSDGTPTYMLAVVVDDIEMNVSHVIRGVDHLTNAFRQVQIYSALGAKIPNFGHIPLIHGEDGDKLSKRHGATHIGQYREMGYLKESIINYLMCLGWTHPQKEFFSIQEVIECFDIKKVSKSSARFNIKKLNHINTHYIKNSHVDNLIEKIKQDMKSEYIESMINKCGLEKIHNAFKYFIPRSENLLEISNMMELVEKRASDINLDQFYQMIRDLFLKKNITIKQNINIVLSCTIVRLIKMFEKFKNEGLKWSVDEIKAQCKKFCEEDDEVEISILMPILRYSIIGTFKLSPPLYEFMEILGLEIVVERLSAVKKILKKLLTA